MSLKYMAVSGLLALFSIVCAASEGTEVAAEDPISGTDTVHGCYGNIDNLTLNGTSEFNTQGLCAGNCRTMGKYVGAALAKDCYCGDEYPPLNTMVSDDECTEPCPGFGTEACGGIDTWTVYNTGVRVSVANAANISDTSSSASSAAAAASTQAVVQTSAGVVVTVTPTATAAAASDSSSGSSKTVGIAVGVVVGIIAVASIAGVAIFITRRRRNREIEEEHRRNAAVNAFISGGKPPSSSGGMSILDQRLDPVMAQRRMSSGSIADEADYSRRILRVCISSLYLGVVWMKLSLLTRCRSPMHNCLPSDTIESAFTTNDDFACIKIFSSCSQWHSRRRLRWSTSCHSMIGHTRRSYGVFALV